MDQPPHAHNDEQTENPNPVPLQRPRRNNTWIYVTIIGLLLATNIYLYFNRNKATEEKTLIAQQLQKVDSSRLHLQEEYNASLARLDELTGKNALLDKQLKDKNSELHKAKSRIQQVLNNQNASAAELKEARNLIKKLNVQITDYENQITRLKTENQVLVKSRDSVIHTNEGLQQQVNLAKVLHASNIRLNAIDLRKGGQKEKATTRAKRVDLLRILFDIDENRLAEDGAKELNIRIINPEQNLLSNVGLGSGSFIKEDGTTANFSVSKTIQLQREQPLHDISVDWKQSAEYTKGDYLVEIYHKGYLIGKGTARLR